MALPSGSSRGNSVQVQSPVIRNISSVHNQPESWVRTLDFFLPILHLFVCMSRGYPALFCYAGKAFGTGCILKKWTSAENKRQVKNKEMMTHMPTKTAPKSAVKQSEAAFLLSENILRAKVKRRRYKKLSFFYKIK